MGTIPNYISFLFLCFGLFLGFFSELSNLSLSSYTHVFIINSYSFFNSKKFYSLLDRLFKRSLIIFGICFNMVFGWLDILLTYIIFAFGFL